MFVMDSRHPATARQRHGYMSSQGEPVIVIGSGMGGMAAAISLAAQGVAVEVHETASVPGGKLRAVEVAGLRLDAGPTVLTMRAVFDSLLAAGGQDLGPMLTPAGRAGAPLLARWQRARPACGSREIRGGDRQLRGCGRSQALRGLHAAGTPQRAPAATGVPGTAATHATGHRDGRIAARSGGAVADESVQHAVAQMSSAFFGMHGCVNCSDAMPPTAARTRGRRHPRWR